jgi:hypothetical protein
MQTPGRNILVEYVFIHLAVPEFYAYGKRNSGGEKQQIV